jgi:hypothetical protein
LAGRTSLVTLVVALIARYAGLFVVFTYAENVYVVFGFIVKTHEEIPEVRPEDDVVIFIELLPI